MNKLELEVKNVVTKILAEARALEAKVEPALAKDIKALEAKIEAAVTKGEADIKALANKVGLTLIALDVKIEATVKAEVAKAIAAIGKV